jgi:hypothetical protein
MLCICWLTSNKRDRGPQVAGKLRSHLPTPSGKVPQNRAKRCGKPFDGYKNTTGGLCTACKRGRCQQSCHSPAAAPHSSGPGLLLSAGNPRPVCKQVYSLLHVCLGLWHSSWMAERRAGGVDSNSKLTIKLHGSTHTRY